MEFNKQLMDFIHIKHKCKTERVSEQKKKREATLRLKIMMCCSQQFQSVSLTMHYQSVKGNNFLFIKAREGGIKKKRK